jgi:predicted metal-dependent hydrolase
MEKKTKIDQIIKTKRKTIGLFIDRQGRLVVKAPYRVSQRLIETFVEQNRDWILKKQAEAKASLLLQPAAHYEPGETFLFLGQRYPLSLVERQTEPLVFSNGFFLTRSAQGNAPALFEKWYRFQAQIWIEKTAADYARTHGFRYNQVRVKKMRSRWGSCSSLGNLNFNYRLILAPVEVVEYVVVHELVHLVHKNHSRDFWDGVGHILPGYQGQRQWLKDNGGGLII